MDGLLWNSPLKFGKFESNISHSLLGMDEYFLVGSSK